MRSLLFFLLLFWFSSTAQVVKEKSLHQQIFQRLALSKTRCVEGEPIMATYTLYTRSQSSSKVVKRPGFKGFGVYDMVPPESGEAQIDTVNGEAFSVYTLRKVQLYPLQAGRLTLEPLEVENDVVVNGVHYTIPTKTEVLTITVDHLPASNHPDFKGAVGSFTISSAVRSKENLVAQDLLELEIVIKGSGNFPVITAPTVQWSPNMVSYPANIEEQYDKTVMPIKGSKTFVIPFMVKKAGTYTLPAVQFRFFDPVQKRYVDVKGDPIELNIKPAPDVIPAPPTKASSNASRFIVMGVIGLILILVLILFLRKRSGSPNIEEPVVAIADLPRTFSWSALTDEMETALQEQNGLLFYQKLNVALDWLMHHEYQIMIDNWEVELAEKVKDEALANLIKALKHKAGLVLYTPYPDMASMQTDYDQFMLISIKSV